MDDTTGGDIPSRSAKPAGKGSWLKENPTLAKLGLLGVLVVVLLVLLAWNLLGSGEKKKGGSASVPPAAAPPLAPAPAPTPPGTPTPTPQDTRPPGNAAPGQGEGKGEDSQQPEETPESPDGNAVPEEEPERPEGIADWKMDDYFSARAENDPRLVEAVGHLGQRFVGKGSAARMLAKLLAPPKLPEDTAQPTPPGYRPPSRQRDPKLIEAVVAALHTNGSEDVRKIFEELLAGTQPTDDDRGAVDATLKVLVEHPCPQYDALLFGALTAAEQLRKQGVGEVAAKDLREKTLNLVKSNASQQFRTELAKHLIKPTTPRDWLKTMGSFLEENHPDNLGAQLVLYRNDETPEDTKKKVGEYFTTYSSEAMGKILGVSTKEVGTSQSAPAWRPPTTGAGSAETAPADPDLPYRIARQLWGAECVAMIADRLGKLESLDKQNQLVAWAGTIPVESMRSAVLKALTKHWEEGSKAFDTAGLPKKVICDPGFLLVAKTLARNPPAVRATTKEARDKLLKTKAEWEKFSDDLVRAWCERFHAAALARAEAARLAGRSPGESTPAASLPITLPTDTKVVATYHVNWPDDVREKLAGVAPGATEVYYVRIEEKARLKTRLGYYKRQLGARTRDVRRVEKTDWAESFRVVPENDRKRSINVLITSLEEEEEKKDEPKPESDEGEDLVVEILSIEIGDPEKSKP